MPRLALTGMIGAGKSMVAKIFADKGAFILDADRVVRTLTSKEGGVAFNEVAALFKSEDRAVWREKAFLDSNLRTKLELILHPLVARESERLMGEAEAYSKNSRLIVYEAALLFEAGRDLDFKQVLFIDADRAIRRKRIAQRNPTWPEAIIDQILDSQASRMALNTRHARASMVIYNNGSPETLSVLVSAVWQLAKGG